MKHTLDSLMDLADSFATRHHDLQSHASMETLNDYHIFRNALRSALSEVIAERDSLKSHVENLVYNAQPSQELAHFYGVMKDLPT